MSLTNILNKTAMIATLATAITIPSLIGCSTTPEKAPDKYEAFYDAVEEDKKPEYKEYLDSLPDKDRELILDIYINKPEVTLESYSEEKRQSYNQFLDSEELKKMKNLSVPFINSDNLTEHDKILFHEIFFNLKNN